MVLSLHTCITEKHTSKKHFKSDMGKGIYGQILVHLYDTATDIGVLIEWGILAYDDNNYKSIDMHVLFWTSIGFLITYRLVGSLFGAIAGSEEDYDKNAFVDCCLGLCDFYILKTVYISLKQHDKEVSPRQKVTQLLESIFESLPQVCPYIYDT